jgi:hemerythrin superfamily protein
MATKRKQARKGAAAGSRGRGTATGGRGRTAGGSGTARRGAGGRAASGRAGGTRTATKRAGGGARGAAARATRSPDAFELLKADHREIDRLAKEFEGARSPRKAEIAEEICRKLSVHAMIEEEIFYPAARQVLREEDLIEEAEVEHQSAKDLMAQIQGTPPTDDKFEARVKVLHEYVKHHVEEEEKEMFTQLRKARKFDAEAIGRQLLQRKQELLGMAEGGRIDAMVEAEESATAGAARGNGTRAPQEGATLNASGARRR